MKKILSILFCTAAVAFTACTEELTDSPDMNAKNPVGEEMTISASMAEDPQEDTKVSYSDGAAGLKWKTSGEKFTAFFSAGADAVKSVFNQISVSEDGKTAGFKGEIPSDASSLLCIYPALSSGNPTAFTLDLTSQVGAYREDKTYMESHNLSTFSAADNNIKVKFNHLTSIIKATLDFGASVSGTASGITFSSPELIDKQVCSIGKDGVKVTKASSTGAITLTSGFTVKSGQVTVYLYAFPSTINSISVSCRLAGKDYKGMLTKTGGKVMAAGKQYNATIAMTETLTIKMDFATCPKYWPTYDNRTHSVGGMPYKFTYNGTDYKFILADATDAKTDRIFWSEADKALKIVANHRYIGLPVIEGYRLAEISCLNGLESTGKMMGVTSKIYSTTEVNAGNRKFIKGGEIQYFEEDGKTYTFNLPNTSSGTTYYLACAKGGILLKKLNLTYVPTDEVIPEKTNFTLRIGTYNVRKQGITADKGTANEWSKRKSRLIKSIKANKFDVFGVQECTYTAMNDITAEIKSTYGYKFFNPYNSGGNMVSNQEGIGIFYNKNLFTISDWHYFWAGTNPDTMSQSDTGDSGNYNRGACCCVLTHKETGLKFFVMNMHGCLNNASSYKWANVYIAREKKYNTKGYPSFFIGDMNARPFTDGDAEELDSKLYREYWTDPYLWLPKTAIDSEKQGTYNGYSAPGSRLDYVYYRGKVEPVKYVCNQDLYDGYFASDHYPVYIDAIIRN